MSHNQHRVMFSLHTYDSDGDLLEPGIYLHFGDVRIRVADDPDDFQRFIDFLVVMLKEIQETWRAA